MSRAIILALNLQEVMLSLSIYLSLRRLLVFAYIIFSHCQSQTVYSIPIGSLFQQCHAYLSILSGILSVSSLHHQSWHFFTFFSSTMIFMYFVLIRLFGMLFLDFVTFLKVLCATLSRSFCIYFLLCLRLIDKQKLFLK